MPISILIDPNWPKPPSPSPPITSSKTPNKPPVQDWCDLAYEHAWDDAIIAYLRERWRDHFHIWRVINMVCAEARPETREQERAWKLEVMRAMGQLIRAKRVFRWKRIWAAILDLG